MVTVEIKILKLSAIKLNPDNPRLISDKDMDRLIKSLVDFPDMLKLREIVVDEDRKVLGGNMRVLALRKIGAKDCTAKIVKGLTPEQKREFVIKDNSAFGAWDFDALANAWSDLPLIEWGLNLPEDWLQGEPEPPKDAEPQIDRAEELNKKWQVKPGDLWLIGEHRLLCGDSTKAEDVARVMGEEKADICFTSPPYNASESLEYNDGRKRFMYTDKKIDNKSSEEFILLYKTFLALTMGKTTELSNIFINLNYNANSEFEYIKIVNNAIDNGLNLRETIIWKKGGMPSGGYHLTRTWEFIFFFTKHKDEYFQNKENKDRWFNFWEISNIGAQDDNHRACFPLELHLLAIERYSKIDSFVYDPFLGSGTTMVACQNLNRKCRGIEISPAYCAVILQRMTDAFPGIEIRKETS